MNNHNFRLQHTMRPQSVHQLSQPNLSVNAEETELMDNFISRKERRRITNLGTTSECQMHLLTFQFPSNQRR